MFRVLISGLDPVTAETISGWFEDGPAAASAVALELEDEAAGRWRLEAYCQDRPDMALIGSALAGFGAAGARLSVEPLADRDWVAESQRALPPIRAGRFFIHGSHDAGKAPPGSLALQIEAGQAFGTGHHETTLGCLHALIRAARKQDFRNILDLGCGTAVLGIAAARLLHRPVTATDIDPVSIKVARDNAADNCVLPGMRLAVADGLQHPVFAQTGPYDLIFANILAGPLIHMAGPLVRNAAPGGILILSGLLDRQAPAVIARYRAAGCVLRDTLVIKNWATLTLAAPPASCAAPKKMGRRSI